MFVRKNLDFKETTSLKFSRNAVVMEITGAQVDITFIDLPGIIANGPNVHFICDKSELIEFRMTTNSSKWLKTLCSHMSNRRNVLSF